MNRKERILARTPKWVETVRQPLRVFFLRPINNCIYPVKHKSL